MEAGIELALSERRRICDDLRFKVLLFCGEGSSPSGSCSFSTCGITFDELLIVGNAGRLEDSFNSDPREREGLLAVCDMKGKSMLSIELLADVEIEIGARRRFFLDTLSDDDNVSVEEFWCLSCRCALE